VRDYHRFLLRELLSHWEVVTSKISLLDEEIQRRMHAFDKKAGLWQTIPGTDQVTAWSLVAEMGVNMEQLATGRHQELGGATSTTSDTISCDAAIFGGCSLWHSRSTSNGLRLQRETRVLSS
jgi:transposase